ncbi:glycosyltransferase [Methylomonas sp. TEB]|uniref:glycosyltransferase n=1 Tax=Methylomonas sp. TEB TaxID=3398229 RepID=UPI0039F55684
MSEQILNVAIPWSLTHYIPLNGFHPLYRALFEEKPDWLNIAAWDNIELSQSLRGDEAFRESLLAEVAKEAVKLENVSLSPIEKDYFAHYWSANQALTRLLPGEIEVHHTAPFPSLCRPFVFHCESFAPVFFPFAHQGTGSMESQEQVRAHYKRIFENPLCLGVFSHLPETITDLSRFFASPIIDAKLHLSRIGLMEGAEENKQLSKGPLSSTRFLFVNSANQNPANFFLRGGHIVLRFWQAFCRDPENKRLFMRCGRPSDAMLRQYGVDLDWLGCHEGHSIIWIEDYLTAHELEKLMCAAHFLLLPSASLHSVSIMQAMGAGAVPVVSDTIGTSRYVVDGKDGIVLSGVFDNNWRQDPECGVMIDQYARNPELEDALVEQLLRRITELFQNPKKYAELSANVCRKARMEFSGRLFSEAFWSDVYRLYQDFLKDNLVSNGATDLSPAKHHLLIDGGDWGRVFTSPPQPVARLHTGQGCVTEMGGCFIASPGDQAVGLHDWSPITEYVEQSLPIPLAFSTEIKGLGGCYLRVPITEAERRNTKRFIEVVANKLMPFPLVYALSSKFLKLLRRLYRAWRQFFGEIVAEQKIAQPEANIELVAQDMNGLNIIRCNHQFYAISKNGGEFNKQRADAGDYEVCIKGTSLKDILRKVEELSTVSQESIELVEEGVCGFNLIRVGNSFFAIMQAEGAFDMNRVNTNGYSQLYTGDSLEDVRMAVERSLS